jgi:hypothetical protein
MVVVWQRIMTAATKANGPNLRIVDGTNQQGLSYRAIRKIRAGFPKTCHLSCEQPWSVHDDLLYCGGLVKMDAQATFLLNTLAAACSVVPLEQSSLVGVHHAGKLERLAHVMGPEGNHKVVYTRFPCNGWPLVFPNSLEGVTTEFIYS